MSILWNRCYNQITNVISNKAYNNDKNIIKNFHCVLMFDIKLTFFIIIMSPHVLSPSYTHTI